MYAEPSRSNINLLALLPGTFSKAASTDGGEYSGPCPRCGGDDRFRVWPDATPKPHAWCRGCDWQPDTIDVLRELHGMDYAAAAAAAGNSTAPLPTATSNKPAPAPVDDKPPSAAWQARARTIIAEAQAVLWSDVGARALRYLRQWRHLTDATIRAAQLGYIPMDKIEPAARWGLGGKAVSVQTGILIPHLVADAVWMLKIRRPTGSIPKYTQPRGGKTALYGADQLASRDVLVFTEGEFDALLLRQECGDLVDVVTLGSATAPLGGRWLTHLLPARQILAAYDLDAAGAKGAPKLAAFSARVQVVRPVGANDLTDMVSAGGNLRAWVEYQLGRDATLPRFTTVNTVPPAEQVTMVTTLPAPVWDAAAARHCYACGETRYWQRADGSDWVCATCHPPLGPRCPDVD